MSRETIEIEEFHRRLKAQGLAREDVAFLCPACGTIQSARSLINAGAGETLEEVQRYVAFNCVGRYTGAGPAKPGAEPGNGCDWTLGGLLRIHELEVLDAAGKAHPYFRIASAEEAAVLAERNRQAADETYDQASEAG